MEWLNGSPVPSIAGIIIAVGLIFIALKMLRSIARPLVIILLITAGILIFFNVLDLAFLASTGKKWLDYLIDRSLDAGKEALANSLASFIRF